MVAYHIQEQPMFLSVPRMAASGTSMPSLLQVTALLMMNLVDLYQSQEIMPSSVRHMMMMEAVTQDLPTSLKI